MIIACRPDFAGMTLFYKVGKEVMPMAKSQSESSLFPFLRRKGSGEFMKSSSLGLPYSKGEAIFPLLG